MALLSRVTVIYGFIPSSLNSLLKSALATSSQCCQNSFERTKSVFLSNPLFQKISARFIERMPLNIRFFERFVFFSHYLREFPQKLGKFPNFFHQKVNLNFHTMNSQKILLLKIYLEKFLQKYFQFCYLGKYYGIKMQ